MDIMKKIAKRMKYPKDSVRVMDSKAGAYKIVRCACKKDASALVKKLRREWVFAPTKPIKTPVGLMV